MSNTMLEAMAIGTPTIATDCPIGGAKAIINDGVNGCLVKVGDEDGIAESLKMLITDINKRKLLAKESIKVREQLNITNICKHWLKII